MQSEDLVRFVLGGCSWGKFFVGLGGADLVQSAASRLIGVWKIYPPSSVACGATFPLEGEGYCASAFCDIMKFDMPNIKV